MFYTEKKRFVIGSDLINIIHQKKKKKRKIFIFILYSDITVWNHKLVAKDKFVNHSDNFTRLKKKKKEEEEEDLANTRKFACWIFIFFERKRERESVPLKFFFECAP